MRLRKCNASLTAEVVYVEWGLDYCMTRPVASIELKGRMTEDGPERFRKLTVVL
jgi:hypothetical protein